MTPPTQSPRVLARERITRAFAEWKRRFDAEPERYEREWSAFLAIPADDYGARACAYFEQLLDELAPEDCPTSPTSPQEN